MDILVGLVNNGKLILSYDKGNKIIAEMRNKKDVFSGEKRAPNAGFFGMRGKKAPMVSENHYTKWKDYSTVTQSCLKKSCNLTYSSAVSNFGNFPQIISLTFLKLFDTIFLYSAMSHLLSFLCLAPVRLSQRFSIK